MGQFVLNKCLRSGKKVWVLAKNGKSVFKACKVGAVNGDIVTFAVKGIGKVTSSVLPLGSGRGRGMLPVWAETKSFDSVVRFLLTFLSLSLLLFSTCFSLSSRTSSRTVCAGQETHCENQEGTRGTEVYENRTDLQCQQRSRDQQQGFIRICTHSGECAYISLR